MGNAIESALSGSAPESRQGFKDGLGERVVLPAEQLEVLHLQPELTRVSSFEFALRERAARLANFQHESYVRVRQIDRLRVPSDCLAIVSDYREGWRLSDVLSTGRKAGIELDIDAALSLVRQLLHAVAVLHRHARGVAHGAIAPERVIVTPGGRAVIVEYVLGAALERLEMTRERLWRDLGIAVPPAAGGPRFDQRADVTQLGVIALALVLGRPLADDEYPHRVGDLLASATESRGPATGQSLSQPLHAWLSRALQLDFRNSFPSAVEAEAAFDALLSQQPGYATAPVAFEAFLRKCQRTLSSGREQPPGVAEAKAQAEPQVTVTLPVDEGPPAAPVAADPSLDLAGLLDEETAAVPQPTPANCGFEMARPPAAGQPPPNDLEQGYPGAFESLFGQSDPAEPADASHVDESAYGHDEGSGGRSRLARIGLGLIALVVLGVGGYFAFGALLSGGNRPADGTLVVESQPTGLTVKIDGQARGKTPLKIRLTPGPHRLELETGGQPRVIPITMAAGGQVSQYIEAASVPVTGRLNITSEPPGAVVLVDGVRKGTAPILVADLTVGRHTVDLQSESGNAQQQVVIEAGVTSSLIVPMNRQSGPVSGWMSVAAPVDLQIFEDGQLIGTSQSDRILMTAGRHELELLNETLGFRGSYSVQVAAGKTAVVRPALPKGALNVNAVPWAEVWIDGQRVGETPIGNLTLTIGAHEVVFRHPQLAEQRHAVTVTTKAVARVSVDLRK